LLDLAQRQRVAPLLFWRLAKEGGAASTAEAIPVEVIHELQNAFYAAAIRGMVAERQLAQVVGALAVAGVHALPVKGAALASLYPDPALRAYSDLDVLVPQAKIVQAEQVLNELGYRCSGPKKWRLRHHYHLPPMVSGKGPFVLEVHWRLDDPERVGRLPVDELWARALPWAVDGQPALRLDDVDAVLHLCRHAVVQNLGRLGLMPVCDLVQAVDGWDPARWEVLVQRARDYGLARAVYFVSLLAEQVVGPLAPHGVMERLYPPGEQTLPGDLTRWFLDAESQPTVHMPATAVRAWSQGSPASRVVYLWQHLLLSRDGMAALYNIPPDSPRIWLTYLLRPLDLLRRYGRGAWRALRGDPAPQEAWRREAWLEQWLRQEDES
jgi:hypothetical protein